MRVALVVALVASLLLHLFALFGAPLGLPEAPADRQNLQAEIRPLPAPPAAPPPPAKKRPPPRPPERLAGSPPAAPDAAPEPDMSAPETPDVLALGSPEPRQPREGSIRYVIYKDGLGLEIGRAEHRWVFAVDGSYRLSGRTETTGLAALLKPLVAEVESRGRLVAGGLQPESFRSYRNGEDANESADFDWATQTVRLSRDGRVRDIGPGTQDILSLNYQLAYLAGLEAGASLGVVTGKKYERYDLDALGEEMLETPLRTFRTLHLRALTDNTTEIWIALDLFSLPVKIRFTDKKGDSYTQIAVQIERPL